MSGRPVEQAKRSALDRLWANVEAALDDEAVHGKYVRFAVDSELYLPAIERYKALAAADPRYAAVAAKWQKAIAAQAAAKVLAKAPREAPKPGGRMARVAIALIVGTLVAGLLQRACSGPPAPAATPPGAIAP